MIAEILGTPGRLICALIGLTCLAAVYPAYLSSLNRRRTVAMERGARALEKLARK